MSPESVAPDSLRLPLWAGRKVGRYEIIEVLGEGGMGVVYSARDEVLRRHVALKLLRLVAHGASQREGTLQLLQEAQAAAGLSHPNIIGVYDVGWHEGHAYVAMEYFEGRSLRRWLAGRTRSVDEVLDVLMQVADALACAHEAGILHRDLKPDNILVDDRGRAKVLDFGLAHGRPGTGAESDESLIESIPIDIANGETVEDGVAVRRVVGTIPYVAPEILEGASADIRTEVYGFFATAYEALFDEPPHRGATLLELRDADPPTPPADGRPIPRALARLLSRGLDRAPNRRPATMGEVLESLRRLRGRHRRRSLVLLCTSLLAVGVTLGVQHAGGDDREACQAEAGAAEALWRARRADIRNAVLGSPLSFRSDAWANVEPRLEAFVMHWGQTHAEQCLALRSAPDPARLDTINRRLACLDHELYRFQGALEAIGDGRALGIAYAVEMVDQLGSPLQCLEADHLDKLPPAPRDPHLREEVTDVRATLARLAAARVAGRLAEARAETATLLEQVQAWDEPALQAEVMLEHGAALAGLHQYERAELALREAVELAERGRYPYLRVRIYLQLAEVLGLGRKRFAEAEEVSRAAEAAASAFEADDLQAHVSLGRAEIAVAAEQHERARELLARLLDEHPPGIRRDDVLHHLGIAWIKADLQRAAETLELAVAAREARYGRNHPRVAESLRELGRVRTYERNLVQAEALLQRARAIAVEVYGPMSPPLAEIEERLAGIDLRAGEDEQAAAHLQRALHIVSQHETPAFDRSSLLSALGVVASRAGRHAEAESLQQQSIEAIVESAGANHPRLSLPYVNLAANAERSGDDEAVLRWTRKALQVLDIEGYRPYVEIEMADALLRLDEPERARRRFEHVLTSAAPQSRPWRLARRGQGEALLALGDVNAAIELLEDLAIELERLDDPEHAGQCRFALARALAARGHNPTRTLELARQALADLESPGVDATTERRRIREWLAARGSEIGELP